MKRFYIFTLFTAMLLFVGMGCSSSNADAGVAGVFMTTDRGQTWQSVSLLPTSEGVQSLNGVSVYRMYGDPQDADAMYWASRSHGLFYSYNAGKTWQQSVAPFNTGFFYSLTVHPKNKCILLGTSGYRVYKSVDCSRSWEEVHREERATARITSLAFHSYDPYEVYMTKANGDVLLSNDQGFGWKVIAREKAELVHVFSDPQAEDILYLTTRKHGLLRSEDRGRTWISLAEGLKEYPSALEYRRFYIDEERAGHLYWISTYGILVSTDRGDSWAPMDLITSPGSADIYGFIINPDNPEEVYYVATINGRSVFYWSQDGGVNWQTESLPSGQLPTVLYMHPEDRSVIYLGFTIPPEQ